MSTKLPKRPDAPAIESTLKPDGDVADWFGAAIRDLAEAFPAFKLRERQIRVYAAALADLRPDAVRGAMARAVTELRYFPVVAELRQFVEPSADDRAIRAWTGLRDAVGTVGAYASLVIDDACAAVALQQSSGTWQAFCGVEDGPGLALLRQAFLVAYRDARRRLGIGPTTPVRLAGICEAAQGGPAAGWTGRLTLDGQVETQRQAALPLGSTPAALDAGRPEGVE